MQVGLLFSISVLVIVSIISLSSPSAFGINMLAIPDFKAPFEITVNPNNNLIYVAEVDFNQTSVFSGDNNTLLTVIDIPSQTATIARSTKLNEVFVSSFPGESTSYTIINSTTNKVIKTVNGTFLNTPTNYKTHREYIGNVAKHSIQVIDTTNNTVIKTIYGIQCPGDMAVNPVLNMIYVVGSNECDSTTIVVINGTTNKVIQRMDLHSLLTGIAVNYNTNMVYSCSLLDNSIYAIKPGKHGLL